MSISAPICVVIADDQTMFREGLRQLLNEADDIHINDIVADGDALLMNIQNSAPDVAVIDVSMPGPGIRTLVQNLKADHPTCKLLVLSMYVDHHLARELLALGLDGYVAKDDAFDELAEAIKTVHDGSVYLSPQFGDAFATPMDQSKKKRLLTRREIECLRLAGEGHTSDQIAYTLEITERTVRFHIKNACEKLSVKRRSQAVSEATRLGYITPYK